MIDKNVYLHTTETWEFKTPQGDAVEITVALKARAELDSTGKEAFVVGVEAKTQQWRRLQNTG